MVAHSELENNYAINVLAAAKPFIAFHSETLMNIPCDESFKMVNFLERKQACNEEKLPVLTPGSI